MTKWKVRARVEIGPSGDRLFIWGGGGGGHLGHCISAADLYHRAETRHERLALTALADNLVAGELGWHVFMTLTLSYIRSSFPVAYGREINVRYNLRYFLFHRATRQETTLLPECPGPGSCRWSWPYTCTTFLITFQQAANQNPTRLWSSNPNLVILLLGQTFQEWMFYLEASVSHDSFGFCSPFRSTKSRPKSVVVKSNTWVLACITPPYSVLSRISESGGQEWDKIAFCILSCILSWNFLQEMKYLMKMREKNKKK